MAELLLKLRPWLTISETTSDLSTSLDQEITEAAVLRLGLDGELTLSLNLVNQAEGLLGRVVPRELATTRSVRPYSWRGKRINGGGDLDVSDDQVLELDRREGELEIVSIGGIWDLVMLGTERHDVESRYQRLTGGPTVTLSSHAGVLLRQPEGTWCQLREELDYEEQRFWHPADSLPKDAVLVVRRGALDELIARLGRSSAPAAPDTPSSMDKSLAKRERRSLLIIIAALAKMAEVDLSKPTKAGDAIERQTELLGERVSSRSIQDHIKKIPEELREGDDPVA
jgi:hypothetical protein